MSLELTESTITKILFLSATPNNLKPLQVDLEYSNIEKLLKKSDKFEIQHKNIVTIDDLNNLIAEFHPNIIHFSGHGSFEGVFLQDTNGNASLVRGFPLTRLLNFYSEFIKCVILNSCYSEHQANQISKIIPYVIGMKSTIKDISAIEFSKAFYIGLLEKNTYEEAFELGYISLSLKEDADKNILELYVNGEKVKHISVRRSLSESYSESLIYKSFKQNFIEKLWLISLLSIFLVSIFIYLSHYKNNKFDIFKDYKKAYQEKYENMHLELDQAVILKNMDSIKKMSASQYEEYLINEINKVEDGDLMIVSVTSFYEGIIKCEQSKNCSTQEINRDFQEEFKNFWNAYSPYIKYKRRNGYSTMAILLERRVKNE